MRLISLEAENVKRIRTVSITFKDGAMVIGGRNQQGKSSCLDAIAMALGGKDLVPDTPLRKGETDGYTTVVLGDPEPVYKVTRRFTAKGTTSLTVQAADGSKPASPQTLLDGLLGSLSFDPLAFSRMEPAKQAETLRALVGLDTSEVDAKIAGAYEERTAAGREVTRIEGALRSLPKHEGVPAAEQTVTALADEMAAANRAQAEKDRLLQAAETSRGAAAHRLKDAEADEEEAARLKRKIAELEAASKKSRAFVKTLTDEAEQADKKAAAVEVPDIDAIREKMKGIEAVNAKVRDNAAHARTAKELREARQKHDGLETRVVNLRDAREKMIRALKFPIKGLSLDETGVQFGGLPFAQASSSEQLRVSVAMGLKMNPRLKLLLIRDGSLLDDDNLKLVGKMAEEAGAQVLIERVGVDSHTSVVIEDGAVKEVA